MNAIVQLKRGSNRWDAEDYRDEHLLDLEVGRYVGIHKECPGCRRRGWVFLSRRHPEDGEPRFFIVYEGAPRAPCGDGSGLFQSPGHPDITGNVNLLELFNPEFDCGFGCGGSE